MKVYCNKEEIRNAVKTITEMARLCVKYRIFPSRQRVKRSHSS